ncbi:MAG: hypothetical protein NWR72_12855 [Bacteroidia bacterium]|nr:hypothetical protein [Bacteroidia bacterium]
MNWRELILKVRRLLVNPDQDGRQGIILLVSFLLSLVLWFLVTLSQSYDTEIEVPVVVEADDSVVANHDPRSVVKVKLRGTGMELISEHLKWNRDTVHLAYDESMLGKRDFRVSDYQSQFISYFPSPLVINGFRPDKLSIVFGKRYQKTVPLLLRTSLSVASPYQFVSEPALATDSITIYGQASQIDTIEQWYTLNVTEIVSPTQRKALVPVDTATGIKTDIKSVEVEVNTVPYTEMTFTVPLKGPRESQGVSVRLSHKEMTFVCSLPESEQEAFQKKMNEWTILLDNSTLTSPFGIWSPSSDEFGDQVKIIQTKPERVRFVVVKKQPSLN